MTTLEAEPRLEKSEGSLVITALDDGSARRKLALRNAAIASLFLVMGLAPLVLGIVAGVAPATDHGWGFDQIAGLVVATFLGAATVLFCGYLFIRCAIRFKEAPRIVVTASTLTLHGAHALWPARRRFPTASVAALSIAKGAGESGDARFPLELVIDGGTRVPCGINATEAFAEECTAAMRELPRTITAYR